ncbi:hypothetical protein Hypma_008656 [Hypsizygus marmoreus]|uniref:Uncharacterized protein n=1 Tax=Hypsizygus marmoreus TaxID=39966 RepID=A0A369JUI0_HYPMA|nr:hypothetical protein Hypma_008656 [Hypsizygus marmoreus]
MHSSDFKRPSNNLQFQFQVQPDPSGPHLKSDKPSSQHTVTSPIAHIPTSHIQASSLRTEPRTQKSHHTTRQKSQTQFHKYIQQKPLNGSHIRLS